MIDRDALWNWLASAPLPVVLSICLSTTGALGGWVWGVASDVGDQKAAVAVTAEQAKSVNGRVRAIEARLIRLEDKLDRLLEGIAELKASRSEDAVRRAQKEKSR